MDNMDEMDDVLRELENGKNPLGFPTEPADSATNNATKKGSASSFRLRSLYVAPIALFLIAIAARTAGNNIVFSAISAAATLVGVLLLSALGVLWHTLNADIRHKSKDA